MTMFRIAYKTSGHALGHYAGETPDEAIAAMARDSSYGNFVASCLGQDVEVAKRELTVEPIDEPVAAGFVVVQQGHATFGVGLTKAEALQDAEEWVDTDEDGEPNMSGLDTVACSMALIDDVRKNGTPRTWGEVDHVLCTVEQEQAWAA